MLLLVLTENCESWLRACPSGVTFLDATLGHGTIPVQALTGASGRPFRHHDWRRTLSFLIGGHSRDESRQQPLRQASYESGIQKLDRIIRGPCGLRYLSVLSKGGCHQSYRPHCLLGSPDLKDLASDVILKVGNRIDVGSFDRTNHSEAQ